MRAPSAWPILPASLSSQFICGYWGKTVQGETCPFVPPLMPAVLEGVSGTLHKAEHSPAWGRALWLWSPGTTGLPLVESTAPSQTYFLQSSGEPSLPKCTCSSRWWPTPLFLPGKSQEQRNLVGYSPWAARFGHNWETKPIYLVRGSCSSWHSPSIPKTGFLTTKFMPPTPWGSNRTQEGPRHLLVVLTNTQVIQ